MRLIILLLLKDMDYRAIPLMRPPSERHERQGVVDTIDDDCVPEVDLDNPKEILPTPLLWDRHSSVSYTHLTLPTILLV